MKNILKLMESTTEHALRPFLWLTLIMIVLNVATFEIVGANAPQSYFDVHHDVFLLIVWMLTIVFVLHIRRMRRTISEGEFIRLRLLPISPTTYFYSELCFVLGTLFIILAGYYISIMIIYALYIASMPSIENGFVYMIFINRDLLMLMPLTLSGSIVLLGQILLVALVITILCMSLYSPRKLIGGSILMFFAVMIAFFIRLVLPGMGGYTHGEMVYAILYSLPFVFDALLIWYGTRAFKKRMIGG